MTSNSLDTYLEYRFRSLWLISMHLINYSFPSSSFGHVFMAETGTSVGEISGQSKPINSADFRPARPFRIVTGSEDNTIAVFEGPPFKFKMTKQVQNWTSLTDFVCDWDCIMK